MTEGTGTEPLSLRKTMELKREIKPKKARATPRTIKSICQYRGMPSGRKPVNVLVSIMSKSLGFNKAIILCPDYTLIIQD